MLRIKVYISIHFEGLYEGPYTGKKRQPTATAFDMLIVFRTLLSSLLFSLVQIIQLCLDNLFSELQFPPLILPTNPSMIHPFKCQTPLSWDSNKRVEKVSGVKEMLCLLFVTNMIKNVKKLNWNLPEKVLSYFWQGYSQNKNIHQVPLVSAQLADAIIWIWRLMQ